MFRRSGQLRRRRSVLWAGAGIAAAWMTLLPLPAQAHAALVSSSPPDGEVLLSAPAEVVLTFDESVMPTAYVAVQAPDGSSVADGPAAVDGATVTQALRLVPQQGGYAASYRVVSDDGHPVTGTIRFTVDPRHATPPASSAACSGSDCSGTSFWHRESTWIVIALGALAAAIALVFALGLRSTTTSASGGDG